MKLIRYPATGYKYDFLAKNSRYCDLPSGRIVVNWNNERSDFIGIRYIIGMYSLRSVLQWHHRETGRSFARIPGFFWLYRVNSKRA